MKRAWIVFVVGLQLLVEIQIVGSGTAFCPQQCTCTKADAHSNRGQAATHEIDDVIDTGWIVNCSGSDTYRVVSIKEIVFNEIENQITHL